MTKRSPRRFGIAVASLLACLLVPGCVGVGEFLDPDFLTAMGIGSSVASLPGDAPALLVTVENRTNRPVEALISYRVESDVVDTFTVALDAGAHVSEALICPILEITMGDISDLSRAGALVRLGAGGANDPYIQVEPFGKLLIDGANYNCGDSLTFTVQASGATASGYQIYAFIQRAEAP